MRLRDRDHPFFRPLWRRVLIVALVAAWAAFELFVTGDGFWSVLAVAILAYAGWIFILDWKPERDGLGGKPPE